MAFPVFSLKVDPQKVLRVFRRYPREAERELFDALLNFKLKFFKTWPTIAKIRASTRRKRGMIGRFQGFVNRGKKGARPSLNALSVRVVSYSGVAEAHETGKVIRAKRGRMRIPIGQALTSTGRTKKRFKWYPKSLRKPAGEMENLVPIKSGEDTILAKKLKSGRIRPMFLLKRQVTIKPGLNFEKTFVTLQPFAIDRIDRALAIATGKAE